MELQPLRPPPRSWKDDRRLWAIAALLLLAGAAGIGATLLRAREAPVAKASPKTFRPTRTSLIDQLLSALNGRDVSPRSQAVARAFLEKPGFKAIYEEYKQTGDEQAFDAALRKDPSFADIFGSFGRDPEEAPQRGRAPAEAGGFQDRMLVSGGGIGSSASSITPTSVVAASAGPSASTSAEAPPELTRKGSAHRVERRLAPVPIIDGDIDARRQQSIGRFRGGGYLSNSARQGGFGQGDASLDGDGGPTSRTGASSERAQSVPRGEQTARGSSGGGGGRGGGAEEAAGTDGGGSGGTDTTGGDTGGTTGDSGGSGGDDGGGDDGGYSNTDTGTNTGTNTGTSTGTNAGTSTGTYTGTSSGTNTGTGTETGTGRRRAVTPPGGNTGGDTGGGGPGGGADIEVLNADVASDNHQLR